MIPCGEPAGHRQEPANQQFPICARPARLGQAIEPRFASAHLAVFEAPLGADRSGRKAFGQLQTNGAWAPAPDDVHGFEGAAGTGLTGFAQGIRNVGGAADGHAHGAENGQERVGTGESALPCHVQIARVDAVKAGERLEFVPVRA
ncbi:MAG: hypothetical protein BWX48_01076 [Verrucomicrobia bacterium ADurb.Bin006]|jgi:hypothetical protein|nr:MAG: hypothetical protein BWX48_01076 [Verrucomicrobia bacterium ADurb.Bin006]